MLIVLVLALLGAVILGAMGWLIAAYDDGMDPADPARPDLGPIDRQLAASDIPALRFRLAFRGYRMSDVDAALERLGESLQQAEAAVATVSPDPASAVSEESGSVEDEPDSDPA